MTEDEYIVPSRAERIGAIAGIAFALILLAALHSLAESYVDLIQSIQTIEAQKTALVITNITAAIMFIALASWLALLGRNCWTSARWPPKGLPLVARTQVRVGWQAMTLAVACLVSSVFSALSAIFHMYLAWSAHGI